MRVGAMAKKRYLYVLKEYVCNRAKPEASIARGYMYAESLGFVSEHLFLQPGHKRMWDPDDDEKNGGEVLEGAPGKLITLHEFIISNAKATYQFRQWVFLSLYVSSPAPFNVHNIISCSNIGLYVAQGIRRGKALRYC